MPNTKLLGPPTRSLERVLSRTDVTPTRLLRVMWPVQRVEVEAESVEYQSFDLIDRFVLRAVAECELSRKSDIAAFLGVSEALIAGACAFLTQIQHLTQIGDLITITVFGRRSLASGSREVPQKSRLYLLFDGVTAQPLPRDYHRGDLTYDPEPSNREWERIPAYAPFPLDHVDRLFRRTDRSDFNLPTHLQALRVLTIKTVYTAVHLVQTHEHEILAFSEAMPDGDKIIGAILRQDDRIPGLIRSTPSKEPDEIWQKWRQGRPFGPLVRQRPDGVWRATYPARAFREHEIAPSRVAVSTTGTSTSSSSGATPTEYDSRLW